MNLVVGMKEYQYFRYIEHCFGMSKTILKKVDHSVNQSGSQEAAAKTDSNDEYLSKELK